MLTMSSIEHTVLGNGQQLAKFNECFQLLNGEKIDALELVYETYGQLNAEKDNVILVFHALATGPHLASHVKDVSRGWWEELVGPGRAIDTSRYFVICINNLGSCYGSTGPSSVNPATNKPYRADFPKFALEDIARSQKLLLDSLGVQETHAVIGGSMGGMLALAWAQQFPTHSKYLAAISMAMKAYPLQKAHRETQRQALLLDSNWNNGHYAHNPEKGLKLARMISHLFYRGLKEVDSRFADSKAAKRSQTQGDVVNYYHYNADKFVKQFDANSYMYLIDAMDNFNLEALGDDCFAGLTAKVRIVSTDSDVLYPPEQQMAVFEMLKEKQVDVEIIQHQSPYGHDAFLVDAKMMSDYIARFISLGD